MQIAQPGGAGTAPVNGTLEEAWASVPVVLTAPAADSYLWTMLDATDGSPPALTTPTAQVSGFTPTVGRRAYRVRLTSVTSGVTTITTRVVHVSRTATGVEIPGVDRIAYQERSDERGLARGLGAVWDRNWAKIDASFALSDGTLDTEGAVTVGATNATSVSVGRAAAPTTVAGGATTIGTPTLTIADAVGGNSVAVCTVGAAARVRVQDFCTSFALDWQASAVGIGADTTIASQAGASGSRNGALRLRAPAGNTALGGGVIVDPGSTVSNVGDPLALEYNGTRVWQVRQNSAGGVLMQCQNFGDTIVMGGPNGASANSVSIIPNAALTVTATAGYLLLSTSGAVPLYVQQPNGISIFSGSATVAFKDVNARATITSATTTTVLSWTADTNRVYTVEGIFTLANDTDNQGACYRFLAAFKNVAGTVTQIGTTILTVIGEDAGQTGLDVVIDFSGTAIRFRVVTNSTDTVVAELVANIFQAVLT